MCENKTNRDMGYKKVLNKVDELRMLIGNWEGQEPSQIEIDMALDKVKKIYETLRFPTHDEEDNETIVEEPQRVEVDFAVSVTPPAVVAIDDEVVETDDTPEVEEDEELSDEEMILDIDILKSAKSERYNKILSLYCDLDTQEPIVKEEPVEEELIEPAIVTVIEPEPVPEPIVTTEPESQPAPAPIASKSKELYKISSQLGINDRFLLANDLFGGDISALSESLRVMDSLDNIDDVMIYIAESYKWDGDSEGAKLLFTLRQNRFL